MECNSVTEELLETFKYERIGKRKEGYNRLIKVNVKSNEVRNSIIEKASSLKTKDEPWKKVYVKKRHSSCLRQVNPKITQKNETFTRNK